jgi:hypothetical protein
MLRHAAAVGPARASRRGRRRAGRRDRCGANHEQARTTPLYEVGAPLAPAAALRTWLDEQPPTTTYRLPVELTVSVLGVTGAALGFAADRLPVKVNDSALGESLADRVAGLCGEDAETCALWLHGTWSAGVFRVVRVEGRVADDERATATHALLVR